MDKELLFKARIPEADVDLPGIGTVRVRGLTRAEAVMVSETNGAAATERKTLALGMVDPQLTEAEVGRWQQASPAGELQAVSLKIAALSGMLDDAPKSGVPADGDEPGAGVRALPRPEAEHDGGPAAAGDDG